MESTIENLFVDYTAKNETIKLESWSIKDFNNVETADRKLKINNKFEFWVHDDALSYNSDYFTEIFKKNIQVNVSVKFNRSPKNEIEDIKDVPTTVITIPHDELFLDILIWIYNKDGRRIIKTSKNFKNLLNIINLGIFLRMKTEFFDILLSKSNFKWKIEYFNENLWSRKIFTFSILEKIVDEMQTNNYIKILALLNWLKDTSIDGDFFDASSNYTFSISQNQIDFSFLKNFNINNQSITTSAELYLVFNLIKSKNLMANLTQKELSELYIKFPNLHNCFDTEKIIKEFIFTSEKTLYCIICKKSFDSIFSIVDSPECTNELYHPRHNSESTKCLHEGCQRRFNKSEYNCCHKNLNTNGCIVGEGKHLIIIEN
jgi:hypothetical protein